MKAALITIILVSIAIVSTQGRDSYRGGYGGYRGGYGGYRGGYGGYRGGYGHRYASNQRMNGEPGWDNSLNTDEVIYRGGYRGYEFNHVGKADHGHLDNTGGVQAPEMGGEGRRRVRASRPNNYNRVY